MNVSWWLGEHELMKKLLAAFLVLTSFLFSLKLVSVAFAQDSGKMYFFYGAGCPHCAIVEEYFEDNGFYDLYPIERKEIYFDRENAIFYTQLLDELGIPEDGRGVPTLVIGQKVIVGDKPIINNFVDEASEYLSEGASAQTIDNSDVENEQSCLDLTLVAVVGASIVDAINPCAFAVLIILMTAVLAAGGGKKALKIGIAFASSIFISYLLMGLGLYRALSIGSASLVFYKLVGWLAIVLGILNLKDYFWYGKGFLLEVPMSWRPRLKKLIRSATSPVGAFGVGFLVSLFLLPCTSGPYIVILGMLAKSSTFVRAVLYLILYNIVFVSPMIIISFAVYKGFKPETAEKIRQKQLRNLHLIAGIIMIAMGLVILLGWI